VAHAEPVSPASPLHSLYSGRRVLPPLGLWLMDAEKCAVLDFALMLGVQRRPDWSILPVRGGARWHRLR
jgi:hypothetical protein